jgi:hypothetical protein
LFQRVETLCLQNEVLNRRWKNGDEVFLVAFSRQPTAQEL